MEILIKKLQSADAKDLFEFESKNRAFFEEMVPSRGEDYYDFKNFEKRHEDLLEEQKQGICQFYLIQDGKGSILGRMNLIDIDPETKMGYLGYRVGQVHTGKGIAKKALELLLKKVTAEGIEQIEAKTTSNNRASQKILEKNGFQQMESNDEEFEMHGQKLKFIYYSWSNPVSAR